MSADRTRHIEALIANARSSLAASRFGSLKLSKAFPGAKADAATGAEKIMLRPILLKGELHLSVLYRFLSKDITKNLSPDAAWQSVQTWLSDEFANAHLLTTTDDVQLITSRKGISQLLQARVRTRASTQPATAASAEASAPLPSHDRAKAHLVALDAAFLQPLGITQRGPAGTPVLVPAMANKFKQINKFLELFHTSLEKSNLTDKANLRVLDFGAGKGYLSFALDHYLAARKLPTAHEVLAVELRPELVDSGNAICTALAGNSAPRLHFVAGDVRTHAASQVDVMVALHACDTATDHAIHFGIRNQASVILCSPCCHKQLRPQMKMPQMLAPLLQHGIHLGQEAEMLTDGLRALLLDAAGYQTQVFEFIATEHTAKNKMILAVRRTVPHSIARVSELTQQIAELKSFYGIREHCLETLLADAD